VTGTSTTPNSSRTGETPVRGNAPELRGERERLPFGVSIFLTVCIWRGLWGSASGGIRLRSTHGSLPCSHVVVSRERLSLLCCASRRVVLVSDWTDCFHSVAFTRIHVKGACSVFFMGLLPPRLYRLAAAAGRGRCEGQAPVLRAGWRSKPRSTPLGGTRLKFSQGGSFGFEKQDAITDFA